MKITLKGENPGVLIIPESQIDVNEPNLKTHFQGYNIESKFLPGQKKARISVLIRENVEYERIYQIEDDWLSIIWIKIRISRNQSLMLMCGYREWQYIKETGITGSKHPEKQQERLQTILVQVIKCSKLR